MNHPWQRRVTQASATINEKVLSFAWDSKPGGRMVGAEESTVLWRHHKAKYNLLHITFWYAEG